MRKALFPNSMKLSQLEDTNFPEAHPANAKPDSDFDDDLGTDSDSDCELLTSEDSSSASDSGENARVEIVWAKAARGVWGLGHVFEDKLYFTKDIVDVDDLCQRIGSPNLCPSLPRNLLQSQLRRASMSNCSR